MVGEGNLWGKLGVALLEKDQQLVNVVSLWWIYKSAATSPLYYQSLRAVGQGNWSVAHNRPQTHLFWGHTLPLTSGKSVYSIDFPRRKQKKSLPVYFTLEIWDPLLRQRITQKVSLLSSQFTHTIWTIVVCFCFGFYRGQIQTIN